MSWEEKGKQIIEPTLKLEAEQDSDWTDFASSLASKIIEKKAEQKNLEKKWLMALKNRESQKRNIRVKAMKEAEAEVGVIRIRALKEAEAEVGLQGNVVI